MIGQSCIVFKNPGTIDPASIKTFGVSVKETENPIGYFGTGLKYALAIYMRLGHKVEIWTGYQVLEFGTRKKDFRGKEFEVVTMNDEDLAFTTDLGKTWEAWQAFREIYCNCLDEKGEVSIMNYDEIGSPDGRDTVIVIRGENVVKDYHERNTIVLPRRESLLVHSGDCEIYDFPGEYIYYRGVRVSRLPKRSVFTYNLVRSVDLTEDRTLKYPGSILPMIEIYAAGIPYKNSVRKILNCQESNWEHEWDFCWLETYADRISEAFKEVLEEAYTDNSDTTNRYAMRFYRKLKDKQSLKNYQPTEITKIEKLQLEKCTRICKSLFHDFDRYEILVVHSLGSSCMALADTERRTMVFSKDCFARGTKFLLSTMIEEYSHLKTGFTDQSRELQTYLFDMVTSLIEEHVIKEPV